MSRHQTLTYTLGLSALCVGLLILLLAYSLAYYVTVTPFPAASPIDGEQLLVPGVSALVALIAGIVALAGLRRGWALAVGGLAAVAAVVAVVLAVLLLDG